MSLYQDFVAVNKQDHDLKSFDCGKPVMNEFLQRFAIKHSALGLSRSYVLAEEENCLTEDAAKKETQKHNTKKTLAAYFTLASSTITRKEIPTTQSLPSYPIPVIILARLAVDMRYQVSGLGSKSLVYALRQAVSLSRSGLPAYGLILDVLDEDALKFYQRFELFEPFTNNPMRLFVPMKMLFEI